MLDQAQQDKLEEVVRIWADQIESELGKNFDGLVAGVTTKYEFDQVRSDIICGIWIGGDKGRVIQTGSIYKGQIERMAIYVSKRGGKQDLFELKPFKGKWAFAADKLDMAETDEIVKSLINVTLKAFRDSNGL